METTETEIEEAKKIEEYFNKKISIDTATDILNHQRVYLEVQQMQRFLRSKNIRKSIYKDKDFPIDCLGEVSGLLAMFKDYLEYKDTPKELD